MNQNKAEKLLSSILRNDSDSLPIDLSANATRVSVELCKTASKVKNPQEQELLKYASDCINSLVKENGKLAFQVNSLFSSVKLAQEMADKGVISDFDIIDKAVELMEKSAEEIAVVKKAMEYVEKQASLKFDLFDSIQEINPNKKRGMFDPL